MKTNICFLYLACLVKTFYLILFKHGSMPCDGDRQHLTEEKFRHAPNALLLLASLFLWKIQSSNKAGQLEFREQLDLTLPKAIIRFLLLFLLFKREQAVREKCLRNVNVQSRKASF